LYMLQHRNIDYFDTVEDLPKTEALQEIVENNKSQIEVVIEDWWEEKYNGDIVLTKELYEQLEFDKRYETLRQFTSKLFRICGKDRFKKTTSKNYGNHYVIQDHQEAPKYQEDYNV